VTEADPTRRTLVLLSVIVPTYNERENLPELVRRIHESLGDVRHEIIVVDDASEDGTGRIAEELAGRFPVRLLSRRNQRGLASAILDGLRVASGEFLCFLDADLSHPPEKIPEMLDLLEKDRADLVIGSRWVAGSGLSKSWPMKRKIDSYVAGFFARPLTPVKDSMSGFMMMRRSVVEGAPLKAIGYKIGLEILVKGRCGRVREIPIFFRNRDQGASKMNARVKAEFLAQVTRLYCEKFLLNQGEGRPR
jgi:dolichol-phosphate mannosyltransferase